MLAKVALATERFLHNVACHQTELSPLCLLLVHARCDDGDVFWTGFERQDGRFFAWFVVCVFGPLAYHRENIDLSASEGLGIVGSDDFAESGAVVFVSEHS